jgi:pyridoxine 5-phosphate synthase
VGDRLKLGVNIDHVATLRQARYATMLDSPNAEPALLEAARVCEGAGADSITVHLRADRRHIQDGDVVLLREHIATKLNFELGNTPEIVEIALEVKPDFVCLVPENRQEITTEGGLDAVAHRRDLEATIGRMRDAGIAVSLFIDPDAAQIEAARELNSDMVELHTGAFANTAGRPDAQGCELQRLIEGAKRAHDAGLQVNAGHGINTRNLVQLYQVPHLVELNIGHHIVSRAVFIGLESAVREMREAMDGYGGE